MSATQNAKVVFEADTRDLNRGAKQAQKDLKDFGKTSNEVTSSIADAFGVNTAKLEQMGNSARELGRQLSESGNAGVAAFGKMLQSINAAQVAIAGLGLGAAISAFKLLTAEAENFKNTVAGANIELQTQAYIGTYQQAMHDFNAATGQSVAEFESKWKKGFSRLVTNFKQNVVNGLTGNQGLGAALAGPVATTIFGGNKEQQQAAIAAAERAEVIAGDLYGLSRQLAAKSVEWREAEAQIAEYRRIAKDDTATLAERTNAIAQAQALATQRYGEEYNIRKKIADLEAENDDLAGSSAEEEDRKYAAQMQAAEVMRQQETLLKSLQRDQQSITKEVSAEAAERAKAAAALEKQRQAMAQMRADLAGTNLGVSGSAAAGITGQATTLQIGAIIKPKYDPKEITDISREIATLVEQGVASVSESIGSLIGDLATGGDAWHNFTSSALSAFGDMAVAVGKMAIATGTATLGIKAALESLNGYVAIAAGAALVALGSAVKSGLSNVASGNYSASASVVSASYGSSSVVGGGYATSALKLEISGKLTAKGSDLEYVFDQNAKRKQTTT